MGDNFRVIEQFDSTLSSVIDSTLGLRCRSFGYQYSEIILSLAFLLNQSDEGLASFHAVGLRFLHLVTCAELVKQAVDQPATVLQQVGIGWIAYLGVAACGVNLHRTAVVVAILVGVFLLRLAPVCFRQHQGQHVEEVMVVAYYSSGERNRSPPTLYLITEVHHSTTSGRMRRGPHHSGVSCHSDLRPDSLGRSCVPRPCARCRP